MDGQGAVGRIAAPRKDAVHGGGRKPVGAHDPPEEDLWNVRRAAQYLGLSSYWVYRAVERGEIPYRKIASSLRFVPAELRAWVDACRG